MLTEYEKMIISDALSMAVWEGFKLDLILKHRFDGNTLVLTAVYSDPPKSEPTQEAKVLDGLKKTLDENGYMSDDPVISVLKLIEELKKAEEYMNGEFRVWRGRWGKMQRDLMVANQVLYHRNIAMDYENKKQAKLMEMLVENIDPIALLRIMNELNANPAQTEETESDSPS